jgi:putative tricarboxylic transport membrane protein
MHADEQTAAAPRIGIATHRVEAVVGLVLLAIGIVVVIQSYRLGAGWTSDGPGSGYFPFYIGLVITISAAGILHGALFAKKRNTAIFVDAEQLRRVLSVLLPAVLYVLAIAFVGLYIASALYVALFMIVLGKYSWAKSIAAALVINTIFFLMFEVWFKVPLFKGSLDPLRFLGY